MTTVRILSILADRIGKPLSRKPDHSKPLRMARHAYAAIRNGADPVAALTTLRYSLQGPEMVACRHLISDICDGEEF